MADELGNKGPQDPSLIDINEVNELCYWMQALEIDEIKLRLAVAEVGITAEAVRTHLGCSGISMPRCINSAGSPANRS